MLNRSRILDAAARVYAEHGFRGATTRRIADAAGVNEVTLFRTFGSKAALIGEALRWRASAGVAVPHALPEHPRDPDRELTAWAAAHMAELRESRALIRQAMSEMDERPEAAPCVAQGWTVAVDELRGYMQRLAEHGFVDWSELEATTNDRRRGGAAARNECAFAAGAMLMSALFSDAMSRDVMPELHPQPADRAPALYVRLFLRMIGCRAVVPATPAVRGRRAAAAAPPAPRRETSRSAPRATSTAGRATTRPARGRA